MVAKLKRRQARRCHDDLDHALNGLGGDLRNGGGRDGGGLGACAHMRVGAMSGDRAKCLRGHLGGDIIGR